MMNINTKPGLHGASWSDTHLVYLAFLWDEGSTIKMAMTALERSRSSIRHQLLNIGLDLDRAAGRSSVTGGVGRGLAQGSHVKAEDRLRDEPRLRGCLAHGMAQCPDHPASVAIDGTTARPPLRGCGKCGDDTGQCNCYMDEL